VDYCGGGVLTLFYLKVEKSKKRNNRLLCSRDATTGGCVSTTDATTGWHTQVKPCGDI